MSENKKIDCAKCENNIADVSCSGQHQVGCPHNKENPVILAGSKKVDPGKGTETFRLSGN